jgi:predicted DNA-binding antitoxin AbrB/MazE fold protein
MLTEGEKTRIVLEEEYRTEVAKKFKSKIDLVETIIKILQGLAIIVGI